MFAGASKEEADKLLRDANKLVTPNMLLFKLKGDWLQATPMFERAALLYRVCQDNLQNTICARTRCLQSNLYSNTMYY